MVSQLQLLSLESIQKKKVLVSLCRFIYAYMSPCHLPRKHFFFGCVLRKIRGGTEILGRSLYVQLT